MARETDNRTVRLMIVFIGMIFEASQVYISCAIKLKVPPPFLMEGSFQWHQD